MSHSPPVPDELLLVLAVPPAPLLLLLLLLLAVAPPTPLELEELELPPELHASMLAPTTQLTIAPEISHTFFMWNLRKNLVAAP